MMGSNSYTKVYAYLKYQVQGLGNSPGSGGRGVVFLK